MNQGEVKLKVVIWEAPLCVGSKTPDSGRCEQCGVSVFCNWIKEGGRGVCVCVQISCSSLSAIFHYVIHQTHCEVCVHHWLSHSLQQSYIFLVFMDMAIGIALTSTRL